MSSVTNMLPVLSKSCGPCTACCTVIAVEPLGKEPYTPCNHLCTEGCSIYDRKPSVCSTWECAWKSGWIDGDERRRPDQLGVIFEFHGSSGHSFLWAYEVWPNAFDSPQARYLLQRLEKKEILVRIDYQSRRLNAPQRVLDLIKSLPESSALLPRCKLELPNGDVVKVAIERIGHEFRMKVIEFESEQPTMRATIPTDKTKKKDQTNEPRN